MGPTTMPWVFLNAASHLACSGMGCRFMGLFTTTDGIIFSREERSTGSIEGSTPVHAATDLVNEKLTFCMHFPIPTGDLDALREVLQEWRIRCPGSAAVGLANVATGRLDGCLEFRSKPWDCAAGYAICEGAGAEFYFVRDPAFPMKTFSPSMGACPFRVGSSLFHQEVCQALGLVPHHS